MSQRSENRIKGRSVSRGIAIGTVVCVYGSRRQYVRSKIETGDVQVERDRFERALQTAVASLRKEIERIDHRSHTALADILDSQLLLIEDASISKQVQEQIDAEKWNAEAAIQIAFDGIASRFRSSSDESFREKSLDLEDVAERLLTALGAGAESISLPRNAVVVANEVRPSTLLELVSQGAIGLIAESGGWTSHTSILAREAKIPAITGFKKLSEVFRDGDVVIVDGFAGEVVITPTEATVAAYHSSKMPERHLGSDDVRVEEKLRTLDGREITIRTNTTSVDAYRVAAEHGAKGIGLFRSESLISQFKRLPTEDEQAAIYAAMASVVLEHPINIRTFDIDADQLDTAAFARQKNPALGLRAIRLGLKNRELLSQQTRALLRAASDRQIGMVVPMVTSISEVEAVRSVIAEQQSALQYKGIAFGELSVGAMIEVPSSVLLVDQLAAETDFLCLGTNDLAQYLLAADRDNEEVSEWFRTLHPAMLRAVKQVILASRNAQKPLTVCGEMAGSPFYVPVLIGLGATELSMNPGSIEAVRRVVAGIAVEEAVDLVKRIESLPTADAIENAVKDHAKENWPHLFVPGFLEMQSA